MSTESVFRALFGYVFLVFIVRIVGRRPGKQLTPFEYILIFFLGGLMLTAVVSDEVSVTNAFCQIMAVALAHYTLSILRARSDRAAKLLDGVPLYLLRDGAWQARTMRHMRIQEGDIVERARGEGMRSVEAVGAAVLERNGDISILPREETEPEEGSMEEQQPVGQREKDEHGVEVGEDLVFQRRWWRFERITWAFFGLVLVADLSGLLGRGPLAKAERHAADGSLRVKYERIARANTASIMTLSPGEGAVHDGTLRVYVSDSLLKELGTQRVIPQPLTSTVGDGGVTYAFAASAAPMTVQLEMKSSSVGRYGFVVALPDGPKLAGTVLVLP